MAVGPADGRPTMAGMRAVIVNAHGGPEAFTLAETPEPVAGEGQVLVRVAVSGINFIDVYHRIGLYPLALPFRAGVEGVGVITAVGAGVTDLAVGQRVGWLNGGQGSFSDLVAVAARSAVPLPDGVDDVTAVALLMQGITAHYLATGTYPIKPGDVALVHAAAGGVGQLLVQIIKHLGGTVIATASSEAKRELVRGLGADHVIPYEGFADAVRSLTGGRGVDVVYDGVGASTSEGSMASLCVRGTLVFFGNASGPVPPLDVTRLSGLGSIFITRPTVAHYARTAEELRARAADLFSWVQGGVLRVAQPTRYDVADVVAAFTALESRATTGKLVLMH